MGVLAYTRNDVMFSVCVPDSCTAQDVKIHLDVALNSINVTAIMYDSSCSSATSPPLNPADYLVILVLLTIVVLVTLSTCYDNLTSKSATSPHPHRPVLPPELPHHIRTDLFLPGELPHHIRTDQFCLLSYLTTSKLTCFCLVNYLTTSAPTSFAC
ncbi:hypothetical protein J6590_081330 [Homalodisca vitripennis]|nr:hypothetical protein J6590_081330 [Homalodisca vitripennis]